MPQVHHSLHLNSSLLKGRVLLFLYFLLFFFSFHSPASIVEYRITVAKPNVCRIHLVEMLML